MLLEKLSPEYRNKIDTIKNSMQSMWSKGEFNHRNYTLHGIEHSENIITALEKLTDGFNSNSELSEQEAFCLLAAAYLHDVGMLCNYDDDEKRAEEISQTKNVNYTVEDLIRDEHHLRSGQYILDTRKQFGLDHIESDSIRLVSEGHRKKI
ncbi:MAG: HD domain-containing protein [Methanococcoides sp.]|nr:HD domain-containing protein [Methanococcoides sp.]